jgi:hypothetical protein
MAIETLGWVSVIVLALTLVRQLVGQWRDRSILRGPRVLLGGQLLASIGLLAYAAAHRSAVLAAATALVLLATAASLWIGTRNRRRRRQTIPTLRSDVIPFRPRHILLKRHGSNH